MTTGASPEIVWKLLVDAASWPLWSKVDSLDRARSVVLDPGGEDGVGAVRAFRTGHTVTGERLTEKVERRLLAYEDAFHTPMHNYHARIELTPTAVSGTVIHWHGTYGTSWLMGWYMPLPPDVHAGHGGRAGPLRQGGQTGSVTPRAPAEPVRRGSIFGARDGAALSIRCRAWSVFRYRLPFVPFPGR